MASDNHAHYTRIGFTVIIGVVAIVATLVYLGGFNDASSEVLLETYSDFPVTGLSVGSPVNMYGVKVGEVRDISFVTNLYYDRGATTDDMRRVSIVMALDKKTLGITDDDTERELCAAWRSHVERGLRSTVAFNGITGLSRIDLRMVDNPPPTVQLGWKPRYPLVPPAPSLIEDFAVAATKLVNRLKTTDFASVWSNVQRTADAAARTVENADALIDSQRAGIAHIVNNVREMSESLRECTATLKDNPSLLLRPADPEPLSETAR